MRNFCATVFMGIVAMAAHAQTATLNITAGGGSLATVAPGTPVRIAFNVTYTGSVQLGYVRGAVRVQGDAGTGGNFAFHIGGGPLINTGSFQGGSRVGIDAASGPPIFFGINPLWANQPVQVMSYDLALDTPGTYQAIWEPPTGEPGVGLYLSSVALYQPPMQVFYNGATITVTPAPASVCGLAVIALLSGRRRR